MSIKFLRAGPQTSTQDQGRSGFAHLGFPRGGALDQGAMQTANWLVGNTDNQPVLEFSMAGPSLLFLAHTTIAITGADLSPKLDRQSLENNRSYRVKPGDNLHFGALKSGCRGYLAIAGNWRVPTVLGSASGLRAGHDELLPGAVWQRGDILQINTPQRQAWPKQAAPESLISHTISVMPGPEFDQLSDTARQQLFGSEHIIDSRSNRMGLRLTGPIDAIAANKQLSSGVTPGTVQLTASGEPIILLADAQTIGGYPRVLQVMSTALDNLAQLKPGDSIELKLAE